MRSVKIYGKKQSWKRALGEDLWFYVATVLSGRGKNKCPEVGAYLWVKAEQERKQRGGRSYWSPGGHCQDLGFFHEWGGGTGGSALRLAWSYCCLYGIFWLLCSDWSEEDVEYMHEVIKSQGGGDDTAAGEEERLYTLSNENWGLRLCQYEAMKHQRTDARKVSFYPSLAWESLRWFTVKTEEPESMREHQQRWKITEDLKFTP